MMLEQVRAGLSKINNKKSISNIVVTALLITVLMVGILVFWTAVKRIVSKSPEIDCINVISSFSLKKACYLNENEIQVELKRGFDSVFVERLRFVFKNNEDNIWEITGKKCSDVRINERRYGGYCEILAPGQETIYIFDMSGLNKKEKIRLGAGNSGNLCEISKIEIEDSC